eukprot:6805482-Prymnesium_polylepis.2
MYRDAKALMTRSAPSPASMGKKGKRRSSDRSAASGVGATSLPPPPRRGLARRTKARQGCLRAHDSQQRHKGLSSPEVAEEHVEGVGRLPVGADKAREPSLLMERHPQEQTVHGRRPRWVDLRWEQALLSEAPQHVRDAVLTERMAQVRLQPREESAPVRRAAACAKRAPAPLDVPAPQRAAGGERVVAAARALHPGENRVVHVCEDDVREEGVR